MSSIDGMTRRLRARLRRFRGLSATPMRQPLVQRLAVPKLLAAFADEYPEAVFIEIGSNDGDQHDHLRPFILSRRWSGIMVEPVPYVFERLRRNYEHLDRLTLENAAVSELDGELPFYYLRDASEEERRSLPSWYDGVGSFRKDVVLRHAEAIPDVERRLVRVAVAAMTFETLCRKHGLDRVDLLVMDTEGYDWKIIRNIDFERWSPTIVLYEHFHLAPGDRVACRERLEAFGYRTMEEGFDTICLAPQASRFLKAVWQCTRPAVAGVSVHEEERKRR